MLKAEEQDKNEKQCSGMCAVHLYIYQTKTNSTARSMFSSTIATVSDLTAWQMSGMRYPEKPPGGQRSRTLALA